MNQPREHRFAPRVSTWPALIVAAAFGGICGQPVARAEIVGDLDRAAVKRAEGIASGLRAREGRSRVRILSRGQLLLKAALSAELRPLLRPSAPHRSGAASSLSIGPDEKRAARRAEGAYETAVARLNDEAHARSQRLRRLARQVRAHGGTLRRIEAVPAAIVADVSARSLRKLSSLASVRAIEPVSRSKRLSEVGTAAVGAPSWWTDGFTGGTGASDSVPADAAIISEAVDPSHPAFEGVTIDNDPSLGVSDHGTHTGGVIASSDATYTGVSYGLDRLIGSSTELYALGLPQGAGAVDPAETFNISFGSAASSDDEDNTDDVLTFAFGVGQAFGAGNDNVDGTPTVGNIGRNVLTVAGFNDVGTVDPTDDVVLGISSRGPTPGGRKKPDLTAPGGAVIAPSSLWNSPPSNPDFTAMTGTSFAAPHVAGAMTLLEGAGIADPMAQRAILINSARDWDGASTGLVGWSPPQTGWRPEVGWGQLDLGQALAERGNYQLNAVREGEAAYYGATVPTGAKATLAYELRGYFEGFPNPGTQTLTYTQSNLDLHQYLRDGEVEVCRLRNRGMAAEPTQSIRTTPSSRYGPQPAVRGCRLQDRGASTIEGSVAEPFAITSASRWPPLPRPWLSRPPSSSPRTDRCDARNR